MSMIRPIRGARSQPSRWDIATVRQALYTAKTLLNPVPTRLITRLKYSDIAIQAALAAGPGLIDYKFNLNSLFQPNITGGGHQPMGHDQLATLYENYRVFKTTYTIMVAPHIGESNVFPSVALTNSNTSYTVASNAAESTFGRTAIATFYKPAIFKGKIDLAELNGRSRVAYAADDETQALMTASPAEVLELHLTIVNVSGSSQTVDVTVMFEFECELFNPVQLGQS